MPDIAEVRAQLAVMQSQIQLLTKTVDGLAEEVKTLTALANQGKAAYGRCLSSAAYGLAWWRS